MKNMFMLVTLFLLFGACCIFANEILNTSATEPSVIDQLKDQLVEYVFYVIAGFFFTGIATLFGYLSIKFPKLSKYFIELKEMAEKEIARTEANRRFLPKELTAKQGLKLKQETVERVMESRPAQELRRGVANLFGIFGGRAKELGKNLFDNSLPGLVDNLVAKQKTFKSY